MRFSKQTTNLNHLQALLDALDVLMGMSIFCKIELKNFNLGGWCLKCGTTLKFDQYVIQCYCKKFEVLYQNFPQLISFYFQILHEGPTFLVHHVKDTY
jgi:hypothetical protein